VSGGLSDGEKSGSPEVGSGPNRLVVANLRDSLAESLMSDMPRAVLREA
jgi:hypothetical protein